MKTTNSKYLIYALTAGLALCGGANTNIAEAASSTARQTVTITIPSIRALYVDKEETIIAIFSNVGAIANEKLQAFKGGVEIAVSDQIRRQYKKLLPIVDWSRIGWVYQRLDSETKSVKPAWSWEKPAGETDSDLEKAVYKQITKEPGVWPEQIFARRQGLLNSSLLPAPRKADYAIRLTIYDDDGLTGISVKYLP